MAEPQGLDGSEMSEALRRLGAEFIECDVCRKIFLAEAQEMILVYPWNSEDPDVAYEPFFVCSMGCRDQKVADLSYMGLMASWEVQSHDAHG